VRTDTLFYQILQTFPQLVFQLVNRPVIPGYTFTSVEVKETGFRFDGIFLPPDDLPNEPIYFIEVQFHSYPDFYHRCVLSILGKGCKGKARGKLFGNLNSCLLFSISIAGTRKAMIC